jgi:hypothetical protein
MEQYGTKGHVEQAECWMIIKKHANIIWALR